MTQETPYAQERRKRRLLLTALFSLLALWLVLHYFDLVKQEERHDRRMLIVDTVEVRAAPPSNANVDSADANSAVRDALELQLRSIAHCLATDTDSRAPATLVVALSAEAKLEKASWALARKHMTLEPRDLECLEKSLQDAPWPRATAALEATVEFTPQKSLYWLWTRGQAALQ